MRRWMMLTVFATGCTKETKAPTDPLDSGDGGTTSALDSGDDGEPEPEPDPVSATVRLLDPLSGGGMEGLSVTDVLGSAACTSDSSGECTLEVAGDTGFQLGISDDSVLEHHLFGQTGTADFTTISFVATPTITRQIYGLLGVTRDTDAGTVVVGLDTPSLAPATGASASIDASSELAFVLGSRLPEEGTTLVAGGNSIVTFVNVPPGPVTVTATGAEGTTCTVTPARTGPTHTVESIADVVSVVTFICE